MDAEIGDTATPGAGDIIEPRFVGAISVVKHEINRENPPKRAAPHQVTNALHAHGPSIEKISRQQAVGRTRGGDNRRNLGSGPAQRLLAEHGNTALERGYR